MVAGRLQEKNGFYYIVLSYTDSAGKRRQPWIGTGLPVKGNKKRAEKMLADTRKDFTIPKGQVSELSPDMAFSDYMRYWLKMMRTAVTETTYSSYCFNVEKHIIPYFEPLGVTLAGLQPRQIQSFYLHEAETLKNTSILRFHANLHKALKYAVRIDLIASNPVDKVDRPKPQAFMASYYSAEEMEKLFEAAQGHKLELIIQLAAFYGLRRAEVMGLRWEAIDFEAKTLTIRHIVTSTRIDGKKILVEADRAKTKSSLRTLPLGRIPYAPEDLALPQLCTGGAEPRPYNAIFIERAYFYAATQPTNPRRCGFCADGGADRCGVPPFDGGPRRGLDRQRDGKRQGAELRRPQISGAFAGQAPPRPVCHPAFRRRAGNTGKGDTLCPGKGRPV